MKISVVIPAYNVEKFIERSINSALRQISKPIEVLVVDDGSTDNTAGIVKNFGEDVVYLYQKNAGAGAARNLGIIKAKGDWVAFLDSDDEWVETHLLNFEKTYALYPSIKWYGAPFKMLDDVSKRVIFQVKKGHMSVGNRHTKFDDYMTAFPPKAYLSTPTMIISKSVFNCVGCFNVHKRTAQDVDMWFRVALRYPQIGYSYEVGALVYRRDLSLTTSKKWNPKQSLERFLESESLAKNLSEEALQRSEPRLMYWVIKLLRSTLIRKDKETLRLIKQHYFKRLPVKYKGVLVVGLYFPLVFQIMKRLN